MILETTVLLAAALLTGGLLAYGLYRGLLQLSGGGRAAPLQAVIPQTTDRPVFLFDGDFLVDATSSANDLIANRPADRSEFDALMLLLERQFPNIRADLSDLAGGSDTRVLTSPALGLDVTLSRQAGLTRVLLGSADLSGSSSFADMERAAQTEELALLRNLTENAPQLVWQEDSDGTLLWANPAYLAFVDQMSPTAEKAGGVLPTHRLFDDLSAPDGDDLRARTARQSVTNSTTQTEHWFEITSIPQAGAVLHYAQDANALVRAEISKREFQQTLAKTFAHLSIGLAIFDAKRKLAMFNPAILDLTGLPIDFLSSRPSIEMVLDRLRENRKLPEPKDYNTWREKFGSLEVEAENGTYLETWNLPDGQTFRVTGRPHPDGGLAFLFEDISAEVLLTRRFRTEIETGQAVLDTLPEAMAVFSNSGTLVMTNAAYDNLWSPDEGEAVISRDLRASIRIWKTQCVATPHWRELETAVGAAGDRQTWSEPISFIDGRHALCSAVPLGGGMTMVKFAFTATAAPAVRKLTLGENVPRIVKG